MKLNRKERALMNVLLKLPLDMATSVHSSFGHRENASEKKTEFLFSAKNNMPKKPSKVPQGEHRAQK